MLLVQAHVVRPSDSVATDVPDVQAYVVRHSDTFAVNVMHKQGVGLVL
jgi:hypothetical protein